MAPVAVTAAGGPGVRLGSQSALRAPFRLQRPCQAPARRQQLVIRAAEADRSKSQDTVGDMTKDQVQAALDRQVQRSQGKTGAEGGSSNGQAAAAAGQTVEISDTDAGAQQQEDAPASQLSPATDEEKQESVRALQELKDRVPLMSQDDVQQAINRLVQNGDPAGASSTSSDSEGGGSDAPSGGASGSKSGSKGGSKKSGSKKSGSKKSGSKSGSAQAAAPASGSEKKEKYDADQTYEDGALLFTADSLSKVNFDELKP